MTRHQLKTAVAERGPELVDGSPGGVIALQGWTTATRYSATPGKHGARLAIRLTPGSGDIRPDAWSRINIGHLIRGYDATRNTTCTRQADGTLIISVEQA